MRRTLFSNTNVHEITQTSPNQKNTNQFDNNNDKKKIKKLATRHGIRGQQVWGVIITC